MRSLVDHGKEDRSPGRIHCVERLRDTADPTTARWILTEGFRNAVMIEYLAYIAATTGDLAGALEDQSPDPDVLAAAWEIIDALLDGGPAEDIDDYADAPLALSRWLRHMEGRVDDLAEFLTLHAVRQFCERDDWQDRLARSSWTPKVREQVRSSTERLLAHPRWRNLATTGLDSDDRQEFWRAERAARILGIDPFEQLLARIDADPLDGPWFQAWQDATRKRAEILVERAARLLDLSSISTGPSTAIGFGPEFKAHSALGWTLQGLRGHPDLGRDVVAAALLSPFIQNRNGALNVLSAVPPSDWPDDLRERLETLATSDPDENLRKSASDLLDTAAGSR